MRTVDIVFWVLLSVGAAAFSVWLLYLGNQADDANRKRQAETAERIRRADEANRIMSDKLGECRRLLGAEAPR